MAARAGHRTSRSHIGYLSYELVRYYFDTISILYYDTISKLLRYYFDIILKLWCVLIALNICNFSIAVTLMKSYFRQLSAQIIWTVGNELLNLLSMFSVSSDWCVIWPSQLTISEQLTISIDHLIWPPHFKTLMHSLYILGYQCFKHEDLALGSFQLPWFIMNSSKVGGGVSLSRVGWYRQIFKISFIRRVTLSHIIYVAYPTTREYEKT